MEKKKEIILRFIGGIVLILLGISVLQIPSNINIFLGWGGIGLGIYVSIMAVIRWKNLNN